MEGENDKGDDGGYGGSKGKSCACVCVSGFTYFVLPDYRFSDDPFIVDLTFTRTNPNYVQGAQPPGEQAFEKLHLQPELLDPPIFVDPLIAGQIVCSTAEVFLDGVLVEGGCHQTKNLTHLFQRAHRLVCSDKVRLDKYGITGPWVGNSAEMEHHVAVDPVQPTYQPAVAADQAHNILAQPIRVTPYRPGTPLRRHPHLVACQEPLRPDSRTVSHPVTMRMGFDLNFPFSTQCSALAQITGNHRPNPALPPGCRIDIKLHDRFPKNAIVERASIGPGEYFAANAQGLAAEEPYAIHIQNISLVYESALLEEEDYKKEMATPFQYTVDTPIFRGHQLKWDVFHQHIKIPLAPGSRFVYILFLHESQMVPGVRTPGYQSSRFQFLPNLEKLTISLLGKEGVLFSKGLEGLGVADGRKSHSLLAYHADMVQKGLQSRTFDEWFPKWTEAKGHDQLICLDLLTDYKNFLTQGDVEFVISYKEASHPRWNIVLFAITEEVHTWTKLTGWTKKAVTN